MNREQELKNIAADISHRLEDGTFTDTDIACGLISAASGNGLSGLSEEALHGAIVLLRTAIADAGLMSFKRP